MSEVRPVMKGIKERRKKTNLFERQERKRRFRGRRACSLRRQQAGRAGSILIQPSEFFLKENSFPEGFFFFSSVPFLCPELLPSGAS